MRRNENYSVILYQLQQDLLQKRKWNSIVWFIKLILFVHCCYFKTDYSTMLTTAFTTKEELHLHYDLLVSSETGTHVHNEEI